MNHFTVLKPIILFILNTFIQLLNTSILNISLNKLKAKENKFNDKAIYICHNIKVFTMLILAIDTILHYSLYSSLDKYILHNFPNKNIIYINIAISVFFIILEMLIKSMVFINTVTIAAITGYIFYYPFLFLYFIGFIMHKFTTSFIGLFQKIDSTNNSKNTFRKELLFTLKDHETEDTNIQMTKNTLTLRDIKVNTIMTHRSDFYSIEYDPLHPEQLLKLIIESDFIHSKIIIWQNAPDNIIGTICLNHIFFKNLYNKKQQKSFNIKQLIKKPFYTINSANVSSLMKTFIYQKQPIIYVIDEFANVEGMLTINDVMQEIYGYSEETDEFLQDSEEGLIISGTYNIRSLNKITGLELPEEEVSIGGFLINLCEHIPLQHEIINYKNIRFKILESKKNLIEKILIFNIKSIKKDFSY